MIGDLPSPSKKMAKTQIIIHLSFLLLISTFIPPTTSSSPGDPAPANSWIGSKYQIECTMCSACDDPCSNPPVVYSPPPPSPPPPSNPSVNCPPPPSPPSSGGGGGYYYSSPPPPYQPTNKYYPPPPFGNYYYYPPPINDYYPHPPPPNPIVPYFPFYFHNPPLPLSNDGGASIQVPICFIHYVIALFVGFLLVY